MKLLRIAALFALTAPCFAQDATPAPRKSPFAGFGNTALDQRPDGLTRP